MNAAIRLSFGCKRTDIPACLCSVDYTDSESVAKLEKLCWRAKLLDTHYAFCIDIGTERKQKSPEQRLAQRLRNLERRAKKSAPLFWEDIVKNEIARRPDYFTLEGVKACMEEVEKQLSEDLRANSPAFSIDEIESALNKICPFINPEIEALTKWRYDILEKQKQLNAMSPEERRAYFDKQREADTTWKYAFANEDEGEGEMLSVMRSMGG